MRFNPARARLALAAAAVVVAAAAVVFVPQPWLAWDAPALAGMFICAFMFVMVETRSRALGFGSWSTYLTVSTLVPWLTFGSAGGLLVLLTATITSQLVRRFHGPSRTASPAECLGAISARLAVFGIPLLLAIVLYQTLGGLVPLDHLTPAAVMLLIPVLIITVGLVRLLMYTFMASKPEEREPPAWRSSARLLREGQAQILVITLPAIFHTTGLLAFAAVLGLAVTQVLRHVQAARTQHALERRVQELSLVNSVSHAISSTLVLDDVLMAIYQHVRQLTDVRAFYIALHNSPEDALDFRLALIDDKPAVWPGRTLDNSAAARVIREGRVLHTTASADLNLEPNVSGVSASTYLGMPLVIGSRVLGVMGVFSARPFAPEEIDAIQTIAGQVALSVRNAMLFAQRSELVDGLSHINDSVQNVLFDTNRDRSLQAACQTAMAITRASSAAVYLAEPHQDCLNLVSSIGLSDVYQRAVAERSFQPDTYRSGPRVATVDASLAAHANLMAEGIAAFVEMPLLSTTEIHGLLVVYHQQPHHYTLTELYLLETLANQITAMLENAHLFQLLERYAFEMTQLVDLSWIATASMDLESLVRDVAHIMQDMMSVSRISLFLIDHASQRVRELTSFSTNGSGRMSARVSTLSAFPELEAMAASADSGPVAYRADTPGLSSLLLTQMRTHAERSVALVPLRTGADFLGAVLLGSTEQDTFSDREWQLVEMAANQIAAQIRNVTLYEETRADLDQRLEQLSLAEELAKQVSSSLDFNQVIGNVLEVAMRVTQADAAAVALITTDDDQFWVIEQRSEGGAVVRVDSSQPREAGVMGRVVREGRTLRVADNQAIPYYFTDTPGRYRSSLAVPLFSGDKIVGVLNVESIHPDFFTERQATFLSSLAGHAVISIENARFLTERQLQIDMLTSLRTLSLRLAAADSTRAVATAVLETGQALLRSHCAVIFQYLEAADDIRELAGHGPDCGNFALALHPLSQTIALEAARTGKQCFVPDIRAHPAFHDGPEPAYTSALAVPIERLSHTRYVLYFGFMDQRALEDRDTQAIDLLASQAAGHLENALLHEQLRAGRDQMRAILDSTRAGMILLDTAFRLEAANPSAQRLMGIDLEDHIGSYFPDVLLQNMEHTAETGYTRDEIQHLARILRQEPEINTRREFYHRTSSGLVYIEEVGSPVLNETGRIIGRLLVLQDITEARLLDEHREDLTRMVIHDLRGPLGAIINGVSEGLVSLETAPGSPTYEDDIQDARDLLLASRASASRLLRLVNSLLDVSRLEARQMELKTESVPLAPVAETARIALAATAQQAGITIDIDIPSDLPPAHADREMIERVIVNLVDNAVRYTPSGGLVRITGRVQSGFIQIRVADNGPGIPAQDRERIFDRFARAINHEPLRGQRGLGLGLTFCKLAVQAHGGTIRLDDNCDLGGACFVFTLPIA